MSGGTSFSWKQTRDCLSDLAQQQLDDFVDNWRRDFNLEVSSPHATWVADIAKRETALEQLFCINSFLDQEVATIEAQYTGLLAEVDVCLNQQYSEEGFQLRTALEEGVARMAGIRDNFQVTSIQDQLNAIRATRLSIEDQNDLALRIADGDFADPPFVVDFSTDRDTYTPGTPIVFDLETTIAIEALEVTIPRKDKEDPFFDEVPETAIESLAVNRRRVTVFLPDDYADALFSVKFLFVSVRLETSTFFVKFDRQKGLAAPKGRFVKRPCPPLQ